MSDRRPFLQKSAVGSVGLTIGGISFSAKSYGRIIGANDRLNVALMGCGRRVSSYYSALKNKDIFGR